MLQEFKEFISGGNVIDLAVGMVMGSAFTAIVNAFVDGIINPIIGALTSGVAIDGLSFTIAGVEISYGLFLSAAIKFLIIGAFMFALVKAVNSLRRDEKAEDEVKEKTCPYCMTSIDIEASRCPSCTSILEDEANPVNN